MTLKLKKVKGIKQYPVCSFRENQHKLYNALDCCMNARDEAFENGNFEEYEELCSQQKEIEGALNAFWNVGKDGIVYADYKMRCRILDIIAAYDIKKDMGGGAFHV